MRALIAYFIAIAIVALSVNHYAVTSNAARITRRRNEQIEDLLR